MAVGIIIVSHSRPLAIAAKEFALGMLHDHSDVNIEIAAGIFNNGKWLTGTDATLIADTITNAATADGLVVLMDIGSSVMSAEMALELIEPTVAHSITLCAAPLVEGLVTAVVSASTGASRQEVAKSATQSLLTKQHALSQSTSINKEDVDEVSSSPLANDTATLPIDTQLKAVDTPSHNDYYEDSDVFYREITLEDPHGMHARPAAALSSSLQKLNAHVEVSNPRAEKNNLPADSMIQLLMLDAVFADKLVFRAWGAQAAQALDTAEKVLASFAMTAQQTPMSNAAAVSTHKKSNTIDTSSTNHPISHTHLQQDPLLISDDNIVIGTAYWRHTSINTTDYTPAKDANEELARFQQAIHMVKKFILQQANELSEQHEKDPAESPSTSNEHNDSATVLQAQATLLRDTPLWKPVLRSIRHGKNAIEETSAHIGHIAQQFDALTDPYLRQRAHDVRSVGLLIQAALVCIATEADFERMVTREFAAQKPEGNCVLLMERLSVLHASRLQPDDYQGIILVHGSATSHAVLIARGRGIPIICAGEDALGVKNGQMVAFDPRHNNYDFDLTTDAALHSWHQRQNTRKAENTKAAQQRFLPATAANGTRVHVMCNITSLHDAALGRAAGAEGSGLVRTESLFSSWKNAPDIDEQADVFTQIVNELDAPITVRLWDCGADKPLAFMSQNAELNPFLGVRGIRLLRRYPHLLVNQLRAGLRAAKESAHEIYMMVPMVTFPGEMKLVHEALQQARKLEGDNLSKIRLPLGMMIEVPAAAVNIKDFSGLTDFVSFGTNDLSQYVLAADRMNEDVWPASSFHKKYPMDKPVLTMIRQAALQCDVPINVCGDMASNLTFIPELLDCGITRLSSRPTMVPLIKQKVREHSRD
ncbi:MAG: dihydroxyacetone kinase phosphoryl donor subunit DhaM [Actinomycetaceae bacterium]|nr:dihydroxyacetone kinase phosphoryl donor subunit DhaM [Actinomycetaceae bacterium]